MTDMVEGFIKSQNVNDLYYESSNRLKNSLNIKSIVRCLKGSFGAWQMVACLLGCIYRLSLQLIVNSHVCALSTLFSMRIDILCVGGIEEIL